MRAFQPAFDRICCWLRINSSHALRLLHGVSHRPRAGSKPQPAAVGADGWGVAPLDGPSDASKDGALEVDSLAAGKRPDLCNIATRKDKTLTSEVEGLLEKKRNATSYDAAGNISEQELEQAIKARDNPRLEAGGI
jgi:hypothetical protein